MSPGKSSRWLGVIAFLVPLALYYYTAAPGVTNTDSGEFATVCPTLGIAHPPGVPTYVVLGYLFSLLPLSASIARRTNLYSSFSAALTVWFAYRLICELWEDADPRMALAGALAFGFSLSLWHWAVITEVYALNILFITIVYWFAVRGRWIGAALFAGLALGIHHATAAMALPAAAFLLCTARRPSWRELASSVGAFVAGLSIYLYLPIRAAQHPIINWGNPVDAQRAWWHVTGKMYRKYVMASDPGATLSIRAEDFFSLLADQVTYAGLALAFIGLIVLGFRYRRAFWFTLLALGFNLAFVWAFNLGGPDIAGYYLPAFLAISWCVAAAGEALARLFPSRAGWAAALLLLAAAVPAVVHFSVNNRHNDRISPLLIENMLRDVPLHSLIINSDWDVTAPWFYRRYVEGYRPDIVFIDTRLLQKSWYLDLLKRDYPALMAGAAREVDLLRTFVDLDEEDRDFNDRARKAFVGLGDKLVAMKKAEGVGVYCTPATDRMFLPEQATSPHGVLYSYSPHSDDVALDLSGLLGGVPLDEPDIRIREAYATMIAVRATYLEDAGERDKAREKMELALRLDPENDRAQRLRSRLASPPAATSGIK